MFHAIDCAELGESSSGGPNIISDGQYQRFTASWAISRWAVGAVHQLEQDLEALPLVEALLLADAHHRASVRSVAGAAERHLVADRGAVDEPADRAHVGPGRGRVVEDRGVARLAGDERVGHVVARGAERLRGGVEVEPVARLVLHLGHQDGLALQAGSARDPVGLGLHPDDLGVRVLADLAHERLAVGLGHPVARLDAGVGGDELVEALPARAVAVSVVLSSSTPLLTDRSVSILSDRGHSERATCAR